MSLNIIFNITFSIYIYIYIICISSFPLSYLRYFFFIYINNNKMRSKFPIHPIPPLLLFNKKT